MDEQIFKTVLNNYSLSITIKNRNFEKLIEE
jgi:hypothetical protein